MAPQFINQILSLFSLGPKKPTKHNAKNRKGLFNRKAHDAMCTVDLFSAWDSTRSKCQSEKCSVPVLTKITDLPPAYSEHVLSSPDVNAPSAQVCPHEMLSFSRLQRLVTLPNFKTNNSKIDALTPSSDFHHRGHDKDTKECQDSCKPVQNVDKSGIIGTLKGFGTYSWRSSPTNNNAAGLVLSFHWEMKCLPSAEVTYSTIAELQSYLAKANIQLCPHKTLHDEEIVNAIHPIINVNGTPVDPIDRYLAKQGSKDCKLCATNIKVYLRTGGIAGRTCRVDTKRYLGKGEEIGNEAWAKQCKHAM